jgi:pyridoxal phosphate enzyme (YggS family)
VDGLASNLARVRGRIEEAARAAGRDPGSVRLLAVTKQVEPEEARALVELGCVDLGENRVPELERKAAAFEASGTTARWHFIGHLQRNKARRVARLAHAIHSVDSERLFDLLQRLAADEGLRPSIYLQVKLADEEAKGGLAPAALPALVERARGGGLPLLGLMTMAPLLEDPVAARAEARRTFEALRDLARALPAEAFVEGRPLLSMGMSTDLEEAVAAGADVVRIGSALFHDPAASTGGGGGQA